MRRRDLWAAGFLLFFGLVATVESWRLNIGAVGRPGPGFFPFYLALGLSIVGLALLVQPLLIRQADDKAAQASKKPAATWKIAWILVGLVLYAYTFETIGFLLATFCLMIFLFRAVDPLSWPFTIGGSIASSLLTYWIFKMWLQVQLPAGPWGL
jgi:hypothetical protein